MQKDLDAAILLVFSLLKKVLYASNYGHFTEAKEIESQCHTFRGYMITGINKRRIKKSFGEELESFFV